MIEHLRGRETETGTARLDGARGGVDRARLPSQRRLHPRSVLSLLRGVAQRMTHGSFRRRH